MESNVEMESKQTARDDGSIWVVVLATEGESHSTNSGIASADVATPIQYRSADGGSDSPLQQSLRYAGELAPRERICVVVAAEHREWWRHPLWFLPASNVTAQPENAAIAQGVSESLQKILKRDRAAKVVLLPTASRARTSRAVTGTARALLETARRQWPRAVEDVAGVASALPC
jgi:hypothetical protein